MTITTFLIIWAFISPVIFFTLGAFGAFMTAKDAAVTAGHAIYIINDKFKKEFRWK